MNPIRPGFITIICESLGNMDNLPEDIIFDIFSRLPVKSLLRLYSVCKSWRSHILNFSFVELHMVRTLTNPDNHCFIVHDNNPEHRLRVINKNFPDIADDIKLPSILNKPTPSYEGLEIFGSCNGLFCLAYKRNRQKMRRRLYLWNPATRRLRDISDYPLIINEDNHHCHEVSFGFGFDLASSDYKVVRIVTNTVSFENRVQVYSLNKNKISWRSAWKEIKVDLKFRVKWFIFEEFCHAIVKGSPYWIVKHNPVDQQLAIVSFTVQSEKFSTISLPDGMCYQSPSSFKILECKESVAVTAWCPRDQDICIWTLDGDSCWIKKFTITNPGITSILGCLKTGEFIGLNCSKLVLYDAVNDVVKTTQLNICGSKTYTYSESLVF